MSQQDMDLLLWLHAEAAWQRDRDTRELVRWRSGQRRKSWPAVTAVPDGLAYAAALARAQGTEGGDEHDELLRQAAIRLRDMHDAARAALVNLDRSEASRRDWAAEAEAVARRYQDLLGAIWLYVDWRYVTRQLTTEQKVLWADAVDVFGDEADSGGKADRWWEKLPCGHTRAEAERSIRHELCAVHPEADS